jgi:hypothetical protein
LKNRQKRRSKFRHFVDEAAGFWGIGGVVGLLLMSVATASAWLHDVGEWLEVEFGDGLECLDDGGVGEGFRESLLPRGILGLQGEQFGDACAA